jgi:uncharacterized protein
MDITPLAPKEKYLIQRYGEQGFTVQEKLYAGSLIITPESIIAQEGGRETGAEFSAEDFACFFPFAPCLLVIGTGSRFHRLPEAWRRMLKEKNILAETMDTGAACRTFNILNMEDRQVCALLRAISA